MLILQHPITFLWRVYVKPFPASLLWISDLAEQGCGYSRDIPDIGLVLPFSSVRKSLHSIIRKEGRRALTSQPGRKSEEGGCSSTGEGKVADPFFLQVTEGIHKNAFCS
jgi:hypothetical protein